MASFLNSAQVELEQHDAHWFVSLNKAEGRMTNEGGGSVISETFLFSAAVVVSAVIQNTTVAFKTSHPLQVVWDRRENTLQLIADYDS